ncbi:MAG: F0F1 ATP synthase subunit epsilon, partial [Rhodocyclaceae bacterium]|nr:F0F1 ATP synthase subunit epsilon [Rhodocyclaceae bacterium]
VHDSLATQEFAGVVQLICADASGSFGLQAGHAPLIAVLRYGLARFQRAHGGWTYLALPGGVLRAARDRVELATVRCFMGAERATLNAQLAQELARTDSDIHAARASLAAIERALARRLAELSSGRARRGQP